MKWPDLFITNVIRDICQLPVWWIASLHKRDSKTWVFGAWFGNSYSDNTKSMYEYVLTTHPEINAVWITKNKQVFDQLKAQDMPVVFKGTKEARRICLKAGYVFITVTANELETLYINGAKQVWLWHGMPLKKIGKDMNVLTNFKAKFHNIFPQNRYNRPDYFASTSHKWDSIFNQAFKISQEQIVCGLPRNDRFFDKGKTPLIEEMDRKYNNPTKIIYMPTFRDNLYQNNEPFNPFHQFNFSIERFSIFLDEVNAVFFYKGHFYDILNRKLSKSTNDRLVLMNESMYDDLYSFIKDADILITDYSSIYFDFLLLKKPVILAPFDKEDYCNNSRSMYFDYDNEIEGIRAYDWNDVMNIVREKKYYVPSQKTIDKFHKYQDGNSSKRITDYLLKKICVF